MRRIIVDVSLLHPEYAVKVREAGKLIAKHVQKCPAQGIQLEGKNFVLTITALKSAVGRQEWFVEYVKTHTPWYEPKDRIICFYSVRSKMLTIFEIWKQL